MTSENEFTLSELVAGYRELISLYQQVADFGNQEVSLINQGDMEGLLEVLQQKEKKMIEVGKHDTQIKELQGSLLAYYKLESFSLKQLFEIIPDSSHYLLLKLQIEIKKLIKQLEVLEEQEKLHEKLLRDYANNIKIDQKDNKYIKKTKATKAYSKVKKTKKGDIDLKK